MFAYPVLKFPIRKLEVTKIIDSTANNFDVNPVRSELKQGKRFRTGKTALCNNNNNNNNNNDNNNNNNNNNDNDKDNDNDNDNQ